MVQRRRILTLGLEVVKSKEKVGEKRPFLGGGGGLRVGEKVIWFLSITIWIKKSL